MWEDPVVKEVRDAGAKLSDEADGDLHRFFDRLRSAQNRYPDRLVNRVIPYAEYGTKTDESKIETQAP